VKCFKTVLNLIGCLLVSQGVGHFASADPGPGGGNGGDTCENHFKVIRDDLRSWIVAGGPSGLELPTGVNLSLYSSRMLTQITNAQVSCVDKKVKIGGAEKTCKNFVDSAGQAQIVCNRKRFMDNNEDQKYVLVHHEYAGLAGFETSHKGSSKYALSNQITSYLQNTVVKRLVVKPLGAKPTSSAECASWIAIYPIENDKIVPKIVRGPSLFMYGKSHEIISVTGYPEMTYEVTAEKNGTISVDMNVGAPGPDEFSSYDIESVTAGFAVGDSITKITYNNAAAGGQWSGKDGDCKITMFRVYCAENLEYANKMLFRDERADKPFLPDLEKMPAGCTP
jgi:hypothetical protein